MVTQTVNLTPPSSPPLQLNPKLAGNPTIITITIVPAFLSLLSHLSSLYSLISPNRFYNITHYPYLKILGGRWRGAKTMTISMS